MKNITFFKGKVLIDNTECILLPLNALTVIFNLLEEDNILEIVQENSKKTASQIVEFHYRKNIPIAKILQNILQALSKYGFGKLKLISFSCEKIIIENSFPTFFIKYRELYKKDIIDKSLFIEDTIQYSIELLLRKNTNIVVIEKKNKVYLQINILEDKKNCKEIVTHRPSMRILKHKKNNLIIKILIENQIKNVNSTLRLWKVPIVLFPIQLFDNLKIPENNPIRDKILEVGTIQGTIAAELQHKLFGKHLKTLIVKNIVEQGELAGMGAIQKIDLDKNEPKLEVIMSRNMKEDSLLNDYLLGLATGCMQYTFNQAFNGSFKNNKVIFEKSNKKISLNMDIKSKLDINKIIISS